MQDQSPVALMGLAQPPGLPRGVGGGNEDKVEQARAKEAAILFGDMEIAHGLENNGEVSPYQQV